MLSNAMYKCDQGVCVVFMGAQYLYLIACSRFIEHRLGDDFIAFVKLS